MDAIVDVVGGLVEAITKVVTLCLKAVGVFVLAVVGAAAGSLVARDYWNWFVAPLGMPHIGLAHAFGLTMFVNFLRTDYSNKGTGDDTDTTDANIATLGVFLSLALAWGLGWLIVTLGGPF